MSEEDSLFIWKKEGDTTLSIVNPELEKEYNLLKPTFKYYNNFKNLLWQWMLRHENRTEIKELFRMENKKFALFVFENKNLFPLLKSDAESNFKDFSSKLI